jgi:hypothetical protein
MTELAESLLNGPAQLSPTALALLKRVTKNDARGSSTRDPENEASEELLRLKLVGSDGGDWLFLTATPDQLRDALAVTTA